MRRRDFMVLLVSAAAGLPRSADAQSVGKTFRVGMLLTANPRSTPFIQAFERKLAELGYVEGRNLIIEYRDARGQIEQLPGLA